MTWKKAVAAALLLAAATGCDRETGKPGHESYIVRKPWGGKTTYIETLHGIESTAVNVFYEVAQELDMRPKRYKEEFDVTVEGDVTIAFRAHIVIALKPDSSKNVIEEYGSDFYATKIQKPFRARVRAEVTKFTVFDVKDNRKKIASQVLTEMRTLFDDSPFLILDVLTGNIDYDRGVKDSAVRAIVKKEESNQRDIQLDIQDKNNEIKEVEAEGIKESQAIIRGSLSRRYNKWNGLKAIEELAGGGDDITAGPARATNTTFLFVPIGGGGQISVILGESILKRQSPIQVIRRR